HSKPAEDVDLKLALHCGQWQNFQRARRENAGVADENVETSFAKSIRHAMNPISATLLVSDVADAQDYFAGGRLLKLGDFNTCQRSAEDRVTFRRQPECDVPAESAASASDSCRALLLFCDAYHVKLFSFDLWMVAGLVFTCGRAEELEFPR